MEPYAEVVEQYREFASYAAGDSDSLAGWAAGVADDPEVLQWLADLPRIKQQPNLVFAAARWHGVAAPGPYDGLRAALLGDDGPIRATILSRVTQTNEVGRLATLTPAFARLAGGEPVALVEVGASAGLCLFPDRYSYVWEADDRVVRAGSGPELTCRVRGTAPEPTVPQVAWRGGVDLHPVDVTDDEAMAWLTTLVWPEHADRRRTLARAIEVARAEPPTIRAGDLLDELPGLVAEASQHGPVLVFHSAVIAYLTEPDRRRFEAMVRSLVADGACHWVSNEGPNVLPDVTAAGPAGSADAGGFVMAVDGRPVAWTHGHGRRMRWFG